jgi:hypothetical protein
MLRCYEKGTITIYIVYHVICISSQLSMKLSKYVWMHLGHEIALSINEQMQFDQCRGGKKQ